MRWDVKQGVVPFEAAGSVTLKATSHSLREKASVSVSGGVVAVSCGLEISLFTQSGSLSPVGTFRAPEDASTFVSSAIVVETMGWFPGSKSLTTAAICQFTDESLGWCFYTDPSAEPSVRLFPDHIRSIRCMCVVPMGVTGGVFWSRLGQQLALAAVASDDGTVSLWSWDAVICFIKLTSADYISAMGADNQFLYIVIPGSIQVHSIKALSHGNGASEMVMEIPLPEIMYNVQHIQVVPTPEPSIVGLYLASDACIAKMMIDLPGTKVKQSTVEAVPRSKGLITQFSFGPCENGPITLLTSRHFGCFYDENLKLVGEQSDCHYISIAAAKGANIFITAEAGGDGDTLKISANSVGSAAPVDNICCAIS